MAGDEVVQLYTRDVLSSVTTYEKNLRGFERIHLQPGEEKEIQFAIHPRDLKLLNSDNEWVIEPGEFRVMIGTSSEDIKLSQSFFVLGEGFDKHKLVATPLVTSDPQTSDALNVLDKDQDSFWEGHTGYFLTFPLNENIPLDHIAIRWHKESDPQAVFEIQISSGGGQFITVFKGSPMELNKVKKYRFNETAGTDLRIRIASGHVKILDVEMIR